MDTRELRNCLGHFATGVTVVTWNDNGNKRGITVNSFTSVSLDPPLVLVSIDKKAKAYKKLQNKSFVINVLAADQQSIAYQFAGKPQDQEVEWEADSDYGPILANTVATIECLPWKQYDGGDHVLFLGKVKNFSYRNNESLLFYKGKFLRTNSETILNI